MSTSCLPYDSGTFAVLSGEHGGVSPQKSMAKKPCIIPFNPMEDDFHDYQSVCLSVGMYVCQCLI